MLIRARQSTIEELRATIQELQKQIQDEKNNHQMTQLRTEKQTEWNERLIRDLKQDLAEKGKFMKQMISIQQYEHDLESLKLQNQAAEVCLECSIVKI